MVAFVRSSQISQFPSTKEQTVRPDRRQILSSSHCFDFCNSSAERDKRLFGNLTK